MRPFSTFSLKPFLLASPSDLETIKRIFLKLSRKYHPDMVQGDKEKILAEERSAALNADFSIMKNPEELLEKILSESDPSVSAVAVGRRGPPPALSADYFELLEWIEENEGKASVVQKKMEDFRSVVRKKLTEAQERLFAAMAKFPFQGEGTSTMKPWTNLDLKNFQSLYEDLKYMKSFLRDIEAKQGSMKHAHSN